MQTVSWRANSVLESIALALPTPPKNMCEIYLVSRHGAIGMTVRKRRGCLISNYLQCFLSSCFAHVKQV